MIKKEVRERVFKKCDGHCAYCGKAIEYKDMQLDHMIPKRLAEEGKVSWLEVENERNYMPACRRCNHYKRGHTLETFRSMIQDIPRKLRRDSYIFRVGEDFGIVGSNSCEELVFYFEMAKPKEEEVK